MGKVKKTSDSHKSNTAVPQAYYNKMKGVKKNSTETGAGQCGSALSFAFRQFGLECEVDKVIISYNQKPYRKLLTNTWGASVIASPSDRTNAGRIILEINPDSNGSLGIAISEAVEIAATSNNTKNALGNVLMQELNFKKLKEFGLHLKPQMELPM